MDDEIVRATLAAHRDDIGRRLTSLRQQLQELADEQSLSSHDDEHDPEGATAAYQRELTRGLLVRAEAEATAVEQAQRRHRLGLYGRCDQCGASIAVERLAALPATTRCIDCAGRRR